jgi:hypothetical protein
MKTWRKISFGLAGICILMLIAGLGLLHYRTLRHQRARARAVQARYNRMHPKAAVRTVALSKDSDDQVVLKTENPETLKDEKNLKGRALWVSAGGQMDYYAYNGKVDYSNPQGSLLGAEKIVVKDAVEQAPPPSGTYRIPPADAHVLLVFTLPDDADSPGKQYAVPVGNRDGKDYNLLTDQLFFYDDPHTLYAYWGPQVWQAIDQHKAIAGMSERQVRMALGQNSSIRDGVIGENNFEYENGGKRELVTFVNGKVTAIKAEGR